MKFSRLAMSMTGAALAAAALTVGLSAALASPGASPNVAHNGAVPNTPRPPAVAEAVYHAITPCRIVDTRNAGGDFHNTTTRTYYVGGTSNFTAQGGTPGGCGVPVGATAAAAALTAIEPSHSGYMRFWPNGQSEPHATQLVYAGANAGTGATLSLNITSAQSLKVKNYNGPSGLTIDIVGYYAQQIQGIIDISGNVYGGSSRILSSSRTGLGDYTVTTDTNVANCAPAITAYGSRYYASATALNGNVITVHVANAAGTAVDDAFQIIVAC